MQNGKESKNNIGAGEKEDTSDQSMQEDQYFLKSMKIQGVRLLAKLKEKEPEETFSLKPIRLYKEGTTDQESDFSTPFNKYSNYSSKRKQPLKKKTKINRNFEPDATLDLHGETQVSGHDKLVSFINGALVSKLENVLVITGKGLNSDIEGGVIKKMVLEWLETKNHPKIRDFRFAPPFLGGEGAVLIFFK